MNLRVSVPAILSGFGLWACQLSPAPEQGTPEASLVAAEDPLAAVPMDLQQESSSILQYLVSKYDGDGDGRVGMDEYDRPGGAFGRLDRNQSGYLEAEDFEAERERGPGRSEMRARMAVVVYFQDDQDLERLTIDEIERVATRTDADQDGVLSEGELQFLADSLPDSQATSSLGVIRSMVSGADPHELLSEPVDEDCSGTIEVLELMRFFESEADEELGWNLPGVPQQRPEGARDSAGEGSSGVAEGEPAPDFELTPPDGGAKVRLSSFRGSKPVALIFGSYT